MGLFNWLRSPKTQAGRELEELYGGPEWRAWADKIHRLKSRVGRLRGDLRRAEAELQSLYSENPNQP